MTAEYLIFDFADQTTLLDKDQILRLLIAITQSERATSINASRRRLSATTRRGSIYVPNAPETLANAWNNAIRAVQRYNGYWMEFENADKLRFSFGFDPTAAGRLVPDRQARRSAQRRGFARVRPFRRTNLQHVAPALRLRLVLLRQPRDAGDRRRPGGALGHQFLRHGADLRAGRERIDAVPAYRKAELDGGVLLEMSANPITRPQIKHYREASAALGFAKYYQGG